MSKGLRIAIASDLHFERGSQPLFFPDVDVIVLAGDIGTGKLAADVAIEHTELYPEAHVVWVAGNHEAYGRNLDDEIERYQRMSAEHMRVHYLEDSAVSIRGITFVGCTLWTDFSLYGDPERAMVTAERLTDFSVIEHGFDKPFRPRDAAARFRDSYRYLEKALAAGDPRRTVVVTHFPPGLETRNQHIDPGPSDPYFQANVNTLIDAYQPALWIYGHNHYSNDLRCGKTRLVSNQVGYPMEMGSRFDAKKVVVIDPEE